MQVPNSASSALQSSSSATDFARIASSPSPTPSFSGSSSASASADGRSSLKRALELSAPGSGIGELDSSEQQLKTDITGKARRIAPTASDSAGVLGLSSSLPSSSTSIATHSLLQASLSNSHVLDSRVSSLSLSSGPAALMSKILCTTDNQRACALFESSFELQQQELRVRQEILCVHQEILRFQHEELHVANATLQIETARVAAERSAHAAAVALAAAGSMAQSPSHDADRNSVRLTGIWLFVCSFLYLEKCSHCSCSLFDWHFRRSTESRRQRPRSRRVRRLPSHPHRAKSSISLTNRVMKKSIWPIAIGFLHRPRLPRIS